MTKKVNNENSDLYTVDEFCKAGAIFNVSKECIEVAFKIKGIEKATLEDGKKLIDEFMKRKVD